MNSDEFGLHNAEARRLFRSFSKGFGAARLVRGAPRPYRFAAGVLLMPQAGR
jgi:hypothetical protein